MYIQFAAHTDVGRSRDHNEDNFLVDPKLQLYVVADGMGGHSAGEVASAMAVNQVRDAVAASADMIQAFKSGKRPRDGIASMLENAVQTASHQIFEAGMNNPAQRGMGTTLTSLLVVGNMGFIAHVGDSRLYLVRENDVHQLTEDHSLLTELMRHGKIKSQKDLDPRFKNAVTRAVGVHETIDVDVFLFDILPGDRMLICSDGLHGYLDNDRVREISATPALEDSVLEYVDFANRKGGIDNITAIVLEASDPEGDHSETRQRFRTLCELPLFEFLNYQEIVRMVDSAEDRTLESGDTVFSEGEEGDCFFAILSGTAEVSRKGTVLQRLGTGSGFGEMALLTPTTRTATVVASSELTLLAIHRDAFLEVMQHNAPLAIKTLWAMVRSLSDTLGAAADTLANIEGEPLQAVLEMLPVTDVKRGRGKHEFPGTLAPLAGVTTGAAPPPPPPAPPPVSSSNTTS